MEVSCKVDTSNPDKVAAHNRLAEEVDSISTAAKLHKDQSWGSSFNYHS